jgi:hypothetical protein
MKSERRAILSGAVERAAFFLALAWVSFAPLGACGGNFYTNTSPANVPWTNGIVPYEFTNTLTPAETNTYLNGLREWQLAANVQFVPHTNQTRWVLFAYNTNWIDNVSSSTNPQIVTIASLSRAQICHEMGHSFGFTHENIRPDQTNYLTVLSNNVASGYLSYFQIDPGSVTNGPYDFESVMHLGWDFGATNPGVAATQQPKPPYFPRYQFRMGNYCLSPGDRAALAYLYGPPAVPLTNIVSTTADFGPGSLRAAIYYATDHPGTTVRFNILPNDPGYSNGVYNIHLTGMLPPLVANGTVIDGSTQPGFTNKPVIFVDGSQILPETFTSDTFLIYSASNQIKNLSFSGFDWNGLTLLYADATNNTISGCWFGLDFSGTNAAPNAYQGIFIANGANWNFIGGTNALARNVISGNSQYGVFITDSNTTGNVVLGNYIGTDAGGQLMVSNALGGVFLADGASQNLIGGTNAGARNVISGNLGNGILIRGSSVVHNTVQGNFIGTDATGTNSLANTVAGVTIDTGSSSNLIGGTVAGARNVISGNNLNSDYGVIIAGPGTSGNVIEGNYVGIGANGMTAVSNYFGMMVSGGATNNTFGGTVAGARNVISGNLSYGMVVKDPGTSGNVVEGNYIGLDAGGVTAVPNDDIAVICWNGATSNLIGGTSAGARNVISGNKNDGVDIASAGTSGNVVEGNFIGTDATGTVSRGNQSSGLGITGGANGNIIGGTSAGAGNLISGNGSYGLFLRDRGTSGNLIQGNFIGTDLTGTNALGNAWADVAFWGGAAGNSIGGIGAGNMIAFSGWAGVELYDAPTTNNSIRGNSIFSNGGPGIDLNGVANDLQNFPVITNAFGYSTSTIISGTLNSVANRAFSIDVYRNFSADPDGYFEGQFYVGTVSVTTGGSGNANFALTNTVGNYSGQSFTVTATSAGGDTSEFSLALIATNAPAPSAQFTAPFQWRTNGFAFSLTLQTNFNYHIQAATNLAAPISWTDLTNFTATNSLFDFTDRTATNYRVRFYHVASP